tara:strand:- start:1320 stop:1910 length:591 start_codon:yes stop_codon:yes gene_type:complete
MSDNNIENWEQDLKNELNKHQEPTDVNDLEAFMGKLESNDFFEPKRKKISVKWTLLAGLLISSVAYWMLSGEQQEEKQMKTSTVIEAEIPQKKTEEIETTVDRVNVKDVEKIVVPERTFPVTPVVDKEEEKVDDYVIVKPVEVKVIDTVSLVDKPKEVPKIVPVRRKPIIIMSTDTIMVTDTSHVKHRKRDKKKKK